MSRGNVTKMKDYYQVRGDAQPGSTIIAIGGGKGGVGKSFVSSNLAIFLSNMGYRTIIADLDLGAANLHTVLGVPSPQVGLNDFFKSPGMSLNEITMETGFENLRLISGSNDSLEMANLEDSRKSDLMSSLHKLEADYTILDLSAGTHKSTLDFFLMASKNIITLTPEPTSIENAYRFMKAAFFRRIKRFELQLNLQDTVDDIMMHCGELGVKSPRDLLRMINQRDPERGALLTQKMNNLGFGIIINQVRTRKDIDLGRSVKSVCYKYFGIDAQFLGHLEYDNAVWQSLRKYKPVLLEYPHSRLYAQILSIARSVANPQFRKAVV